uniref:Uncharacterized protein n=1 Tax=Rhizophora mucronata TaxID=61149 RepID=A0A2P2PBA1_RHIMU
MRLLLDIEVLKEHVAEMSPRTQCRIIPLETVKSNIAHITKIYASPKLPKC